LTPKQGANPPPKKFFAGKNFFTKLAVETTPTRFHAYEQPALHCDFKTQTKPFPCSWNREFCAFFKRSLWYFISFEIIPFTRLFDLTAPMHKAIHICNSLKANTSQKLEKSMSLPTLTDRKRKKASR